MHRRELSNSFAARYSGTRLHVQHGQQYRQSAVLYALACSTVIQEPQKMKAYVFSSVQNKSSMGFKSRKSMVSEASLLEKKRKTSTVELKNTHLQKLGP